MTDLNYSITGDQLKRLQTLWGQYARRELIISSRAAAETCRDARLRWASDQVKREISSFSSLTLSEASSLIDILQGSMGIAESSPARRSRRYRSSIKDRNRAHAAGTEGRHNSKSASTIACAEDLAMIDAQVSQMGWDRQRLDAFLRSPSSPLGKKRSSDPQLRTVGDVNRVLWALKRIGGHGSAQSQAEGALEG